MSWKKYFAQAPDGKKIQDWMDKNSTSGAAASRSNYQSFLPEVYAGPPNRLERYNQYDVMDTDSVVSASLDVLAEFCTQKEEKNKEYFEFEFKDDASEAEIEVLKSKIREWTELNDFDVRLRGIVRQCLKYGDSLFVRDPETYAWIWVDPYKVEKVVVNEAQGKKPEEYWISDPDLNLQTMTFTNPSSLSQAQSYPTGFMAKQPRTSVAGGVGNVTTSAIPTSNSSIPIPAQHIVHLSLGEGLDLNWPFGNSILEPIYKTFKQKELLEDAILIYRIHRAPERRVFYVDVGNMPSHRIMTYLEHVKNEINQRRIPTKGGGSGTDNIMDAAFNPQSMTEDFFFPQMADGRGSRVDTLSGGENLGQINDLDYFDNKLKQGLKIPSSYITGASTDDTSSYNDGQATTALISEYKFQKYCERIQSLVNDNFDREFKLYLKAEGVQIDASLFQLVLNVPQNFARYRQIELDNSRIATWSQIADTPYISKRFALKRWLGLTEDEIVENEMMWKEENKDKTDEAGAVANIEGLSAMGIRPEPDLGFDLGFDEFGDEELGLEDGDLPIDGGLNDGGDIPPPPPPGGAV